MGPGRRAARWRISVILPMIQSSVWRKAAGALMMMVLSVTIACLRLFTAVSRATFKCRVISTELSADLGRAFASAKHGACCALSVERIAFSVLMSELTIGVVRFDNSMPLRQHDKKLDFKIPIQVEALRAASLNKL